MACRYLAKESEKMIRMSKRLVGSVAVLAAAFVLLAGYIVGAGSISAQGEGATPAGQSEPHPAHIHSGTCTELGDVVYPLGNVVAIDSTGTDSGGTPVAAASPAGTASAGRVETSFAEVDASLDDLVAGGYAINVHEAEANIGTYIACGDIGGTITPDPASGGRQLVIALRELNTSGYSGVALLREADGGTDVTLYLVQGAAGGTPEAAGSGQSDEAGTVTVTVEIRDFAYGPETVTIPAGGTVTWTNQDSAPHTATARDRDVLQSGTLEQGESYSQTFDTPGPYEYFCEFHAGMKGTIIIE